MEDLYYKVVVSGKTESGTKDKRREDRQPSKAKPGWRHQTKERSRQLLSLFGQSVIILGILVAVCRHFFLIFLKWSP